MSKVITKIIMWLAWSFVALTAILEAHYVTKGIARINSFSRSFDVFAIGMFFIPILICGGLRFWLSRIRNPWLALLPFFSGIFLAYSAECFAIFLFPEFYVVFHLLAATLFIAYLPASIRLRPAIPNASPAPPPLVP